MFDEAEAARRRIAMRAVQVGELGAMYTALADALMLQRDTAVRTLALKRLADSCDSAMVLMKKKSQPRKNRFHHPGSPG